MNSYIFYISDRRYSVPQFVVVNVGTDDDAVAMARKYLAELKKDYLSIDIVHGEREVARVER